MGVFHADSYLDRDLTLRRTNDTTTSLCKGRTFTSFTYAPLYRYGFISSKNTGFEIQILLSLCTRTRVRAFYHYEFTFFAVTSVTPLLMIEKNKPCFSKNVPYFFRKVRHFFQKVRCFSPKVRYSSRKRTKISLKNKTYPEHLSKRTLKTQIIIYTTKT